MSKTVFNTTREGTVLKSSTMNGLQEHIHDGEDDDGHAPKIDLETCVEGVLPITNTDITTITENVLTAVNAAVAVNIALMGANTLKSAKDADVIVLAGALNAAVGAIKQAVPPGMITSYGGAAAPYGWHLCDGTPLDSNANPSLFAMFGNTYPDLRGRFVLGQSGDHAIKGTGGLESVTLTDSQCGIPVHSHGVTLYDAVNDNVASGKTFLTDALSTTEKHTVPTDQFTASDAADSHTNMPPYYVLTYIIKEDYPA